MRKKVLLAFGTRPEAIKMAPVVYQLKKNALIECVVAVTAQHRELLDDVLSTFQIVPDFDLGIMKHDQSLVDLTTNILQGFTQILKQVKPDLVFVHGDTTTTYASSLASFYQKIPVAHVEAGLRSNNIYSPWPEEINRQCCSRIATLHFAPTKQAGKNLMKESISENSIYITGNTVVDALSLAKKNVECTNDPISSQTKDKFLLPAIERKILAKT